MRLMRGSGARGLAALEAPSPIVRPFLSVRRASIARYAAHAGITWIEDPGNTSDVHLRNRVRHDLLPALRRVNAGIDDVLLEAGRSALRWRRDVDALVDRWLEPVVRGDGGLEVLRTELDRLDADSLAVVWGALAGRVGLALDRRGTERLASFIMKGAAYGVIPLSGGWTVEASREHYVLGRRVAVAGECALPTTGSLDWGGFRFRQESGEGAATAGVAWSAWSAWMPEGDVATVRAWRAGDRLGISGGHPRRRVARYLSEAGLHGAERMAWPVIVSNEDEDVVWIPGVRRSDAATERSGRPVRHFVCERIGR